MRPMIIAIIAAMVLIVTITEASAEATEGQGGQLVDSYTQDRGFWILQQWLLPSGHLRSMRGGDIIYIGQEIVVLNGQAHMIYSRVVDGPSTLYRLIRLEDKVVGFDLFISRSKELLNGARGSIAITVGVDESITQIGTYSRHVPVPYPSVIVKGE